MAELVAAEVRESGWADAADALVIESFEPLVLARLRERGIRVPLVQLIEADGAPWDLRERDGSDAATYASMLTETGLDALADAVEGISPDKRLVLAPDRWGRAKGPAAFVGAAHDRGLRVFTWTCRPENAFLLPGYRRGGGKAALGDWRGEWAVLRDADLDGVFVDHPDLGVEFFRAQPRPSSARPREDDGMTVDVTVVGGGISGLACARRFRMPGGRCACSIAVGAWAGVCPAARSTGARWISGRRTSSSARRRGSPTSWPTGRNASSRAPGPTRSR